MSSPVALATRPAGITEGTAAFALDRARSLQLPALRAAASAATRPDVERVLLQERLSLGDFAVLLSPAAAEPDLLEAMARRSHKTTVRRFGRTMHLFAPLYLSNECVSTCTYCGFSAGNEIARRTLDVEEVVIEAKTLAHAGFRHILLVSGEHPRLVSKHYMRECIAALAPIVAQLAVEVQVWDEETYRTFVEAGCDGLVVYQETYDPATYAAVHLKGKKRNYDWRLGALDRGAAAGMRRLGVGALYGLHGDWREDAIMTAAHAEALVRRWWRCEVTVSLPRLRPCALPSGDHELPSPPALDDRSFTQLLCALRLFLPDIGIVLSTREPEELRDALLPLGVTQVSAGSHTEPGGYTSRSDAEPQFDVADTRSPDEVAHALRRLGYDPVWKDWQRA